MATFEKQAMCPTCGKPTLFAKDASVSDGMGCLASILTGGLFLPVWAIMALNDRTLKPYRCRACGGTAQQ